MPKSSVGSNRRTRKTVSVLDSKSKVDPDGGLWAHAMNCVATLDLGLTFGPMPLAKARKSESERRAPGFRNALRFDSWFRER